MKNKCFSFIMLATIGVSISSSFGANPTTVTQVDLNPIKPDAQCRIYDRQTRQLRYNVLHKDYEKKAGFVRVKLDDGQIRNLSRHNTVIFCVNSPTDIVPDNGDLLKK